MRNPSLGSAAVAAEKFVGQWCCDFWDELSRPRAGREHRNEAESLQLDFLES